MKEELNGGTKAEQEGSGRTMLVERRLGVTGVVRYAEGGVLTPKGHTLAFWFGLTAESAALPRPLLYSGITMQFYYQKGRVVGNRRFPNQKKDLSGLGSSLMGTCRHSVRAAGALHSMRGGPIRLRRATNLVLSAVHRARS